MTTTPSPELSSPSAPRRNPSIWVAAAVAALLAALETRRLITFVRWERTLPFARDFLPGAIATAACTLAAYLLLLLLIAWARQRKWGLALGIGWAAIETATPLWPQVKNLWYLLAWHLHLTGTLRHIVLGSAGARHTYELAALHALLAFAAAFGFARSPRDRLDRGILLASFFYAAFYFLTIGILARLVTPH